eukprot:6242990-Amphidinium_carterae.1
MEYEVVVPCPKTSLPCSLGDLGVIHWGLKGDDRMLDAVFVMRMLRLVRVARVLRIMRISSANG